MIKIIRQPSKKFRIECQNCAALLEYEIDDVCLGNSIQCPCCQFWNCHYSFGVAVNESEDTEKVIVDLKEIAEQYRKQFEDAKADTVREFAEKVKERCIKGGIYPAFVASTIDQIAKEMLGEKDDNTTGHPDPVGPKGVNGYVSAAVHAVKEKFTRHFGTYTGKDTVKVADVFALLEKICREVEETDFDTF